MNYYEHHIGDFLKKTAHLSIVEEGIYRRLLDRYYIVEGPLPADVRECCKLARAASKPERSAVSDVLREFFDLRDDGWHQKRADEEIARYQDKQAKAKRSAEARWSAQRSECERISEGNANASADAMRTHSEGNAPRARPQTPDTRHQTPDKAEKRESRSPSGSRIPDGFPGEPELAYCRETRPDLPAETVAQVFRDHWVGKPGKDGRKLDWPATWRVWVARERGYTRNAGTAARGRETTEEHNRRAFAEFLGETEDDGRTIDA